MAYHGHIPYVKSFLSALKTPPNLLEVGIDRGTTFLPLVTHLARTQQQFLAVGVDIMVHEHVSIQLAHIDRQQKQQAYITCESSLTALPKLLEQGFRFDVVLLDGDHNYYTVSREMPLVTSLVSPGGILIIDDYDGKWSERDLWYSERDERAGVANATQRVETEKHGVKPAVDEWLAANAGWQKTKIMHGEPIVLRRAQ